MPLQAGDAIPADCIIADKSVVRSNESALTGKEKAEPVQELPHSLPNVLSLLWRHALSIGEAEDIRKSLDDDCFLLSR